MKAPTTLLTAMFLLLASSVHAQWAFGIKGSFVRSSQNIAPDLTYVGYLDSGQTINGYSTSFSVYYQVVKHLQIGIEPGLVRRGNRTTEYSVLEGETFSCWDYENNSFNPDCKVEKYGDFRLFAELCASAHLIKRYTANLQGSAIHFCKSRRWVFVAGSCAI
ncbi:MAG: hypothetical protein R2788_05650 [Saprospiraceae bacterium]